MTELTVTKSNDLIEASYKLNAQAQKLVLACLGQLDPRAEIPKSITLTTKQFADAMGIKNNVRRDLYKAADSLFDSIITIKTEHEEARMRWIQKDVKKHKGEGAITLYWSDDVLKYISQLQARFTTYRLQNIALLQSSHSIRLYELLMQFQSTNERVITLVDFKKALGIEDKYPEFKILNRAVIKPAIAELNKNTNISVKYESIKKGRSVASLFFDFKIKNVDM